MTSPRRLAAVALSLVTLALAAGASSCSLTVPWVGPSVRTVLTNSLVSFEMSGGIAGDDDRLVVDEQGSATLTQRGCRTTRASLSPVELAQLREALRRAEFGSLRARYVNGGSAADFSTYTLSHAGYTVTTEYGAIPSQLQQSIDLLAGLVTRLKTPVSASPQVGSAPTPSPAVADITEYAIPNAGSNPKGITAGPDGNLWFIEGIGQVAKVTTSGVITEYAIPTPASSPNDITAGPDGNLWFTEGGAKVAKVTTSGVFTEYPLPCASGPSGITAGPDGNLWFTENSGNQVAKMTTSGAFTEYPIPTAKSDPQHIAAGPDGNLWFIENSANQLAKVTTSGIFTEYPIPTAKSYPSGITAGPDGNLWFTEDRGNKVAKVTTSGAFTEYPIPTDSSYPAGIAAGPDGNVWFVEFGSNKVAKAR
jgi:streptogramin lyase